MHATPGDWLIVETSTLDHEARRARIVEVLSPDGAPPYRVTWADDDHTTLVCPGADSRIVTDDALAELDRARAKRLFQHG